MELDLTVLLFIFVALYKFVLAATSKTFRNCIYLLETKRKKTKKRSVPKHHQKVIAQPDGPEVQAGKTL